MFIGFSEDYEEYKKEDKKTNTVGDANKIAFDDIPNISEDDLLILRQTRLKHNPYDVYMQSDVSFYDTHYNMTDSDMGLEIDEEFLQEVKGIRRVYKDYAKYLYAISIREEYLDLLVDKYGGEEIFLTYLQTGLVKDWIPPKPLYAKNSPDYKNFLAGKLGRVNTDWDDDSIIEAMEELFDELGLTEEDIKSMKVHADVLVDPILLNNSTIVGDQSPAMYRVSSGSNNSFDGVSTSNLSELQRVIQSWMTGEPESNANSQIDKSKMFNLTADAIREAYYTAPIVDGGGLANAIKNGVQEEELDPNEMLIDSVTGRPMTRADLNRREFIRFLSSGSDWNELRLMKHLGVGSNFELKLLEQKRRSRTKNKKKAQSFMYDIVGDDPELISSIDQLNDVLFDD